MNKEIVAFGDNKIEKSKFHHCKKLIDDVDIDNILISNNISSCRKNYQHFIFPWMMIIKLNHLV